MKKFFAGKSIIHIIGGTRNLEPLGKMPARATRRWSRFDGRHFKLSVDPMRVISSPYTLNASTGLVCKPIGNRIILERKSVARVLDEANPALAIWPLSVTPERLSDDHAR
ncbi:MAG: hypothetical protein ACPL4E_10820 [Thermoproteota archaeon]